MANIKISELVESDILVGDEILPIVQEGITKKVSITQIVDKVDSYTKSESDDLFDTKVDKVTGKGLSTNDLTNDLLTLLNTKNVKNVTTDAVNDKLVITYTDDTTSELNINDIITDVYVSGASLDATTNVLTLTSSNGGADITVNLSDFVNSSELTTALATKQDNLVSGTNIKTINGQSVLGSGDMVITGGGSGYTKAEVDAKINAKHSTAYLMAYSN